LVFSLEIIAFFAYIFTAILNKIVLHDYSPHKH